MGTILTVIRFLLEVRKMAKEVHDNANARLSAQQAKKDRLTLERYAKAIEQGRVEFLPKWLQWICNRIKLDNRAGAYFLHLLKSEKLKNDDPALYAPH